MGTERTLAVDFGARFFGLAVTDPLGITAQGLPTLDVASAEEALSEIEDICHDLDIVRIILGYPVNMDGSEGPQAVKVKQFGEKLGERMGVPVLYRDERMTSQQALKVMHVLGKKTKGNRGKINEIAAVLILQEYLQKERNS